MQRLVDAVLVATLSGHVLVFARRAAIVSMRRVVLVHLFQHTGCHIGESDEYLVHAFAQVRTFLWGIDWRLLSEFGIELRDVFIVCQTWLKRWFHFFGQHVVPVEFIEKSVPSNWCRVVRATAKTRFG